MNPAFLDSMSWEMAEVYGAITDQILVNLAHYFPYYKPGGTVPKSAFTYQADMLAQMGQVNRETMAIIKRGLKGANAALSDVLEQAIIDSVSKANPPLVKAVKMGIFSPPLVPVVAPNQMRAYHLYYKQACDKLNLVNTVMLESTGSAYRQAVNNVVTQVEQINSRLKATQTALDIGAGETITGVSSWNQALRHSIDRMKRDGITGFIDHGGHRWSAEAYTAMDIRTTVMNTGRAAVWETNQNFGNDLYLVSYHNGARPLCYEWQNKVISSTNNTRDTFDLDGNTIHVYAQSETTYGEAAGLFGINCKHVPDPFIPGVSIIRGEPQNEEENAKTYAESQEQRRLERKLREEKRDILMAKAQGASPEEIRALQEKARNTSQDIDDFCESTGRARHRDREGVYTQRSFPDADRYDVSKFERDQKDMIDQFYQSGGAQREYQAGVLNPKTPTVPITPTQTPAPQTPVQNVAPNATQTTAPVVQSTVATQTVTGVKDFDELETYMKNTHNITVDASVRNLDLSAVRDALSGFENVASQFPGVSDSVKTITTSSSGVMSCTGSQITFNPKYYTDRNTIEKTIRTQVTRKFWPKGTTVASIGAHETAHAVEYMLIQMSQAYTYGWEQTEAWNNCTEAKAIVREAVKAVKKTLYGKGKKQAELFEAISGYAKQDRSETMAEAFADHDANGNNANVLSLQIVKETLRVFAQYKGGTP